MKTKATAANGTKTSTTAKATPKKKLSVGELIEKNKPAQKYNGQLINFLEPHEIPKRK
jgi:hypothetical protein